MREPDVATSRSIGVPGVALVVLGAVLVVLSFTVLDWYPGSTGPSAVAHITFGDLRRLTSDNPTVAIATAYFRWLAWVLLTLLVTMGILANLPNRLRNWLRIAGFVVGLAGAAVTYLALARLARAGGGSRGPFEHAQAGVWLAIAGYLLAGAGAAVGATPRRC